MAILGGGWYVRGMNPQVGLTRGGSMMVQHAAAWSLAVSEMSRMHQQAQQPCGDAWNLLTSSTEEGFSVTSFWSYEDLSCLTVWQGHSTLHIAGTSLQLHDTGKDSRKNGFGLCTVRSNQPAKSVDTSRGHLPQAYEQRTRISCIPKLNQTNAKSSSQCRC